MARERQPVREGLAHQDLVAEDPYGVAHGAMPFGNLRQRMSHNTEIAGMEVKIPEREGVDIGACQILRVKTFKSANASPSATVSGNVEVDALGREDPGEGIEEEIELHLVNIPSCSKIDGGIEKV